MKTITVAILAISATGLAGTAHAYSLTTLATPFLQDGTKTERNGNGDVRKTETKGDHTTTTTTSRDGSGTTTETKTEKTGKKTDSSTTTTTDSKGNYTEDTSKSDGTSSKETGKKDAAGNKMSSDKTDFGKDGKPTGKTHTDYKADGTPDKVTEKNPSGKTTKETKYNDDGSTTVTEYGKNGLPNKVVEKDKDGKVTKETDVDNSGKPTKTREYDEDGGWTEQDYKNGKPDGPPRKYNKDGKLISSNNPKIQMGENATLQGSVIAMPENVVPGEKVVFTVVSLAGEVIPNTEVKLSNGANGSATVTTDAYGNASFDMPKNWNGIKAEVFTTVASAVAISALSRPGGSPMIQSAPKFITGGSITHINGENFTPTLTGNTVTFNGNPGRVIAASPTSLAVITPSNMSSGNVKLRITNASSDTGASISSASIGFAWDPGPSTLTSGQSVTRTLRITGTTERVPINITDPQGDAAKASTCGMTMSTGGENNVVNVRLQALSAGTYALKATLINEKAEADRKNAELSAKDAAGWSASEQGRNKQSVEKANAAANSRKAAADWMKAAEAREKGNDSEAELWETAAQARDHAANAWGSSAGNGAKENEDAAAKAEDAARGDR